MGIRLTLDPRLLFIRQKRDAMREFTLKELARYHGLDGAPAHVAYDGKVYDVTDSFLWRRGRHQVIHQAGQDLTRELDAAPHGPDLLARVPVVGVLV